MLSQDQKNKLESARSLIKHKDYDLATRLLRTIEHPMAQEWLAEIEAAQIRKRRRERPLRILLIAFTIALVGLVGATIIYLGNNPQKSVVDLPTKALLDTPTATYTATPLPTATWTPQVIVLVVTSTLSPTASNTFTPSSTYTDTSTNTPTVTLTPSSTITFTRTPRPTPTLASTATLAMVMTSQPRLYYVSTGTANLYTCTRVDCDVAAKLTRGDPLIVVGSIHGQSIIENDVWYSVYFNDTPGYIHSSMVSLNQDVPPTALSARTSEAFPTVAIPETPAAATGEAAN